jgi:predicted nucleic acid-binding protein
VKIVADTNTFLAVALNEPEKDWLVGAVEGHELVAPDVLPYEVGNALSALARRGVLNESQLAAAWDTVMSISVELVAVDLREAMLLAAKLKTYAYDAYFLQCSLETRCPLLTLDRHMKRLAETLGIRFMEPA